LSSLSSLLLDANTRSGPSAEVIVFLTDRQGTYTTFANHGPAKTAKDKNCVIYSIGLGSGHSAGPLQDMAVNTGGKYYSSPTAANLQAIFDEIFEEVLLSTVHHNVDVTAYLDNCITLDTSSISHE
jgi:Ca-activated chloride channel family protein